MLYLSFGSREHLADNNFGLSKYAQGSAMYFGVNAAAGSVKPCRLPSTNLVMAGPDHCVPAVFRFYKN